MLGEMKTWYDVDVDGCDILFVKTSATMHKREAKRLHVSCSRTRLFRY
jgi:hypothetical protein